MEDDSIEGPINLVSPKQDTNRGFGEILGKAIGVPVVMGMPSSMVKLLMGERAVVLLEGQNVAPTKALAHGYQFQYPDTESAINQVLDDRGTYF
jgi:NAD dependent epimerase/dehydratase family enzyme